MKVSAPWLLSAFAPSIAIFQQQASELLRGGRAWAGAAGRDAAAAAAAATAASADWRVRMTTFNMSSTPAQVAAAELAAGPTEQADVLIVSAESVGDLVRAGLLQPLDAALLASNANVSELLFW